MADMTTVPVDILLSNEIYKQRLHEFTKARQEAEAAIKTAKAEQARVVELTSAHSAELQKRTAALHAATAAHTQEAGEAAARVRLGTEQAAELLKLRDGLEAREKALAATWQKLRAERAEHDAHSSAFAARNSALDASKKALVRKHKALKELLERDHEHA